MEENSQEKTEDTRSHEGIWEGKAILLVDLDAFFASVEQLDHPAWRGKPVIVGGDPDKRGVVSTASYEARKYGVHSAMPSSIARRLCPNALWTPGHFARYRELSDQVMDILSRETPFLDQVSIDEAFLDVTPTRINHENPVLIAQRIQTEVSKLGITCSIGVATSKSIAKIASDLDKPNGLVVVYPGTERAFLDPLPVRSLSGIGKASEEKLKAHGILTLKDLSQTSEDFIYKLLGKNGLVMRRRAQGLGDSDVTPDDEVKSVSCETSFAQDLYKEEDVRAALETMAAKVGRRLRKKGLKGQVLTLKIRFKDRSIHTVQKKLYEASDDEIAFIPILKNLLREVWHPGTPIRLIGVAVSDFGIETGHQGTLFAQEDVDENYKPAIEDGKKRKDLLSATDRVKNKFGEDALVFGRELRMKDNSTGSSAKNPADYK
ncbi:MAG: DNA polymerase IV [Eggerthellaceae bacterium]|jgi:DNA polymerase-4